MNREYWLWDGQNATGPHTLTQLSERVSTGQLSAEDQVQVVGGQDWQSIRSLLPTPPSIAPAPHQGSPRYGQIATVQSTRHQSENREEAIVQLCPSWCSTAMWIGGVLWFGVLVLNWIVSAQYDSYQAAQESFWGLGGLWRMATGQAEQEYSRLYALQSFGSFIWRCATIAWGAGFLRWVYWIVFQRPKFVSLGNGPLQGYGFVFQPPMGWTVEVPIGNHICIPMCFGPEIDGFRSNVIFTLDPEKDSLESSLARIKVQTAKTVSNWSDISCDSFTTNEGSTGIRLISQGSANGKNVRWNLYIFQRSDGYKLQITFTTPQSQGSIMDAVYDQCVTKMAVDRAPFLINPAGTFAIEGPVGWSAQLSDDALSFLGPVTNNIQSMMHVVMFSPSLQNGALERTATLTRTEFQNMGFEEMSFDCFVTQTGKRGYRICLRGRDDLGDRSGISYLFEGKIGKFALNCEFSSAIDRDFDLFDACAYRLKFV